LKKLDALELDIENFHNNIGELAALSQGLVSRHHFDSDNIQHQQVSTEARYGELQDLAGVRRKKLIETKKLFEFFREADDVIAWIREKEAIAESDDYGTDIEHVQVGGLLMRRRSLVEDCWCGGVYPMGVILMNERMRV